MVTQRVASYSSQFSRLFCSSVYFCWVMVGPCCGGGLHPPQGRFAAPPELLSIGFLSSFRVKTKTKTNKKSRSQQWSRKVVLTDLEGYLTFEDSFCFSVCVCLCQPVCQSVCLSVSLSLSLSLRPTRVSLFLRLTRFFLSFSFSLSISLRLTRLSLSLFIVFLSDLHQRDYSFENLCLHG